MDDRIDFGDRWWQTIVAALRGSAAFVVVMAPESERSEWVHREVLLALKERKPIFPLLLRGEGFAILVDTQYADVTGGRMPPDDFCNRLREVVPAQEVSRPVSLRAVSLRLAAQQKKPATLVRHHPFQPEMILIPAGHFLMGSNPAKDRGARDDEQPQHTLHLPDYYIARTPITNAQYAAFVQATDHEQPEHWKRGKPPRGKEDHPVAKVSWHDALAYCNWLTELTGRPYRLPSEAEWEKAARGTDGRIYPWGDELPDETRCNFGKLRGGRTTPVGHYSPQGDSPYGCVDMAGNVCEWTRSLWGKSLQKPDFGYPYDPGDGREDLRAGEDVRRVLRGGAFLNSVRLVRCACRIRNSPSYRDRNYGFRVCVVSQRG